MKQKHKRVLAGDVFAVRAPFHVNLEQEPCMLEAGDVLLVLNNPREELDPWGFMHEHVNVLTDTQAVYRVKAEKLNAWCQKVNSP